MALRAKLVASALCLTRNRADAEDLVQCAFIRAFERGSDLDPETNWQAWFRTVVRRLGIDLARQRRRRRASANDELEELVAPSPEESPTWEWVSEELLATALKRCDTPYRDVLLLHYVEKVPYAVIAERLRLPMGTVATRLHRGRIRLREKLESLRGQAPCALNGAELVGPTECE
jgi:RNA polymerase sigma-70 factor (ECF subfamily)